jgi:hypothetical protein
MSLSKTNDTDADAPDSASCNFGFGIREAFAGTRANGGFIAADGDARNNCFGTVSASSSTSATATMRVWLIPVAGGGCCNCQIECVLQPRFTAQAWRNTPAQVIAAGVIDISSTCGAEAQALGGVQVGSIDPITVTLGPDWSTQLSWDGEYRDSAAVIDNDTGVTQSCSIVISIASAASMTVNAGIGLGDWHGEATGSISGASPGIEVVATCLEPDGPCAGLSRTFRYE